MATYFRKTIKILPWVTLNINKSGMSVSIGPRGAKLNIGKKGAYVNTSIPGTGVYNKTKVGSSLLWGAGTLVAFVAIGYCLGILLQNFTLFIVMCVLGLFGGIAAFFISRSLKRQEVVVEEEEIPATNRKTGTKKTGTTKSGKKTATIPTRSPKNGTRTSGRTATRTDKASADAYIDEVQTLLEKMAATESADELKDIHTKVLDIMYTNIKPLGVKVFDMDFDDAMEVIEQEYAEGLKQLTGNE